MRAFVALLFIALIAPLCLAADTPAKAAIAFAEGLRDNIGNEKLLQRCALNPETGDRKKDQIMGAWKSCGEKMMQQGFEIAEETMRGTNAAVILTQVHNVVGSPSHVLSFAVVKRGDEWMAAPVMSSFQNSVVSYDAEILQERQQLEQWMLSREIFIREELQRRSAQRLLESMQRKITVDQLKSIDADKLLQGLITAIREQDQVGALARLGGYSSESLPEWDTIVRQLSAKFASGALQKWPWSLLTHPQSLHAFGTPLELGDETTVDLLVLHPDSISEEPDFLTFSIQQDAEGRARVIMPEIFWQRDVSEDEMGQIMDYEDEEQLALYQKIYEQSRKRLEGVDLSRAEALMAQIESSLQNNEFATFWGTGAAPAKKALLSEMPGVIALWKKLQGSAIGSSLFGRVGFLEEKDQALLVLQSYAPRNTEAIQLHKLWLERSDGHWKLLADEPEQPAKSCLTWYEELKKTWSTKLADALVVDAVRIGGLAQSQPDPAKVREVFQSWLQAVQERSLKKVIPFCAAFQDDRSILAMMKAMAGELMYGSGRHEIMDVAVHGRWATVSAKYLSDQPNSAIQYPLYVFVATDHGPRMLSQVELKLGISGNRSRNYLNNIAFTELKKYLPDAAVDELRTLYDKHTALVDQQPKPKP
ncbi:MAG: hypothetical protein RI957_1153 [Verrucomicrobiota bacterium]|jgi:hypothetical protein